MNLFFEVPTKFGLSLILYMKSCKSGMLILFLSRYWKPGVWMCMRGRTSLISTWEDFKRLYIYARICWLSWLNQTLLNIRHSIVWLSNTQVCAFFVMHNFWIGKFWTLVLWRYFMADCGLAKLTYLKFQHQYVFSRPMSIYFWHYFIYQTCFLPICFKVFC